MSSLSRKMRRAKVRKSGDTWPTRERPYREEKRGLAYSTLHPTKGWKRTSAIRLRAQARLGSLIEYLLRRRGTA